MTSHKLAKRLLELPDVMVTVNGYEGGVYEITGVVPPKDLHLNVHDAWYYGEHEYHGDDDYCSANCKKIERKTIKAIHLK